MGQKTSNICCSQPAPEPELTRLNSVEIDVQGTDSSLASTLTALREAVDLFRDGRFREAAETLVVAEANMDEAPPSKGLDKLRLVYKEDPDIQAIREQADAMDIIVQMLQDMPLPTKRASILRASQNVLPDLPEDVIKDATLSVLEGLSAPAEVVEEGCRAPRTSRTSRRSSLVSVASRSSRASLGAQDEASGAQKRLSRNSFAQGEPIDPRLLQLRGNSQASTGVQGLS
eukprot:gnl/TRDRNA2_/TRDRNA2_137515_c0_seq2.p1 gnl/TRDRNA2_/TRDRNA2_137515_c0~~gnl/TRDRNA2_/TRDRNA2_137515_c0_seq2.p1  ORF type:complete len:230 (-),score=37.37 gnl/TRDRNA2_/TRDRNA2_137515_c0_seq2:4-693(-)